MNSFFQVTIKFLLIVLLILSLFCSCVPTPKPVPSTESTPEISSTVEPLEEAPLVSNDVYTELEIPSRDRYPVGAFARCPWDMIVWEDRLYVGSGDYGDNAGPVHMWCYDFAEQSWNADNIVNDEEISRFRVLGDVLIAPGVDPTDDWEFGNYYVLNGTVWQTKRNIPGGIHNFDMIAHDGKIFCALGVSAGQSPIACSTDGGETFVAVSMYRDGILLDTVESQLVRVYDFFLLGGELYAMLSQVKSDGEYVLDLFRYEKDAFVYDNQWKGKLSSIGYTNHLIGAKAVFGNRQFLTTGYLYATDDMENLMQISFPNGEAVFDLLVYEDALYALCCRVNEDGKCVVSVWKNGDESEPEFVEILSFEYDIPAISFAIYDGDFYFGMGNRSENHVKNGVILMIENN